MLPGSFGIALPDAFCHFNRRDRIQKNHRMPNSPLKDVMTLLRYWLPLWVVLLSGSAVARGSAPPLPVLKVSDNKRFLVTEDGKPFFYLGDTAWELFDRLNREEADRYLVRRAQQGFTVIQAVAIAELDGHTTANA